MSSDQIVTDPDGCSVVLSEAIWQSKILRDQPEMADHLADVLHTVAAPDHIADDPVPARQRYYRRDAGPSQWLLVVASFEQEPRGSSPRSATEGTETMDVVNIHIGHLTFDHADYDADNDVLYLHIGEPQAAEGEETPEGHLLRFAPGTQDVVGLTIVGARERVARDGRLIVTVPEVVEASNESLAGALQLA